MIIKENLMKKTQKQQLDLMILEATNFQKFIKDTYQTSERFKKESPLLFKAAELWYKNLLNISEGKPTTI
jgi:hypothetical protein